MSNRVTERALVCMYKQLALSLTGVFNSDACTPMDVHKGMEESKISQVGPLHRLFSERPLMPLVEVYI